MRPTASSSARSVAARPTSARKPTGVLATKTGAANARVGGASIGGAAAKGGAGASALLSSASAAGENPMASSLRMMSSDSSVNAAAVANSIVAALNSFGIINPLSAHLRAIFANVESQFGGPNCELALKPQGSKMGTRKLTDGEEKIAQRLTDAQNALRVLLARRDEAVKAADSFDQDLAVKLETASKLQEQLAEVTAAKSAAEGRVAELESEVARAREEVAIANQTTKEADEDLDIAERSINELNAQISGLKQQLDEAEEQLADAKAINEGLETDKEELREQVVTMTAELERLKEEHAKEVATLSGKSKEEATSAATRIQRLQMELASLQDEHESAQADIQELQKKLGVTELDIIRLRGERDNAAQAKRDAEMMLEATRREAESSRTSTASMFEQFNRQTQLHHGKEMELSKVISEKTAKVEELQQQVLTLRSTETSLQGDLRESKSAVERLTSELDETKRALAAAQAELTAVKQEHGALKIAFADLQTKHAEASAAAEATQLDLREKLSVTQNKLLEATEKLAMAETASAEWRAKERLWRETEERYVTAKTAAEESIEKLKLELSTVKANAGSTTESTIAKLTEQVLANEDLKKSVRNMAQLKKKLAESEALVAKLQEEVLTGELARRALHNTVQELKGNIRVFVRVRPFLSNDLNSNNSAAAADDVPPPGSGFPAVLPGSGETIMSAVQVSPDGTTISIVPPPPRGTKESFVKRETKPTAFTFDNVFSSKAGQQDVFDEVQHLVQSALDGYQVCLFAYGQTGAGKSFTMVGDNTPIAPPSVFSSSYSDDESDAAAVPAINPNAGLIPRSVKLILDTARKMETQGWKYTLEVSFLEIYNESIRDLLVKGGSSSSSSSDDNLGIHQDGEGNPEVPGLTKVAVSDSAAIDSLLVQADKRRAVACTNMNERSSRSHQVFTLYIRGVHQGKGIAVNGTLNLCDLAGSERLSRSGAEGERKKEAAAINKSLSCLADVFSALSKKAPHVPFRNSKLTHLLQRCFKGDGKTLMLVNLSPTLESAFETLCSLRFASQVSQVEMGKPVKKVVEALPAAPVAAVPASSSSSSAAPAMSNEAACDSSFDAAHSSMDEDAGHNSSFLADEDEVEGEEGNDEATAPTAKAASNAVGSKRPASSSDLPSSSAAAASAGVMAKRPATATGAAMGARPAAAVSKAPTAASSNANALKKAGASRNLTAPTASSSAAAAAKPTMMRR